MKKFPSTLKILTTLVFTLAFASLAQAQATRTWVSGVGDDVNPCSRTAPCKTFSGAISKTAEGGEINALDPGGFGTLTITKAITVDGTTGQGFGGVLASGASGFTVNICGGTAAGCTNAHPSDAVVILRNLSINGMNQTTGPGVSGVRYLEGARVFVENCTIFGFNTAGIDVNVDVNGFLGVENTTIENTNIGVRMNVTGSPTLNASLRNVVLKGSNTGLDVLAGTASISNSLVANNINNGIIAEGAVGSVANVDNCVVTNNGTGINAATGVATVRINNNGVYANGTGISNSGTMQSWKNNKVFGNTIINQAGTVPTDISAVGNGAQ
jgi:hypothetical protein